MISEMLRRDLGDTEDRILAAWPIVAFRCAIEAFSSEQLDQSWLRSIPRHRAAILGAPWLELASFDRRSRRRVRHLAISSESHEDSR